RAEQLVLRREIEVHARSLTASADGSTPARRPAVVRSAGRRRAGGARPRAVRPPSGARGASLPPLPPPAPPAATGGKAPPAAGNGRASNGADAPSTLRREILLHLRQSGPSSPDSLAAMLGASRTGVLQQLHALEATGLVSHAAEKHGVGRPRHLYDVT